MMRWRSVGSAIAATSAVVGVGRPCSSARVLAPFKRVWEARGPAPHSMYLRVTLGAFELAGRDADASATQYFTTDCDTGIARIKFCMPRKSVRWNCALGS